MSESDLGKALLKGEDAIDLTALTRGVIRRDRRRVWILAAVCVLAWMSVVMLPWGLVLPGLAKTKEIMLSSGASGAAPNPSQHDLLVIMEVLTKSAVASAGLSMICMLTAALCTVLLITISRRATLRQLNARMAEISAHVKMLAERGK